MLNINKIKDKVTKLIEENEKKENEVKEQENKTAQPAEKTATVEKESAPKNITQENKTVLYEKIPGAKATLPERPKVEAPVYERVEYSPKTDEQLEAEVEENLKEYKDNALKSFDSELETTKNQKEREKLVEGEKRTEQDNAVTQAFDNAQRELNDSLIRKGMNRSSTAELLKEQQNEDRVTAHKKVADEYATAIAELDNDIAKAEAKRQQAINDFNVTYALKYADRISKLKAERDKAVNDAIEHNNSITKQEFKDSLEKAKTESQLYSDALDQRQAEMLIEAKEEYRETSSYEYKLYTILRNQLASMSKEDAYNALRNDPTYVDNLTTNYYLQLVDEFGRGQFVPYIRDSYGEDLYEK